MRWIAAAGVLICLVILVVDLSRRWGRPQVWIGRSWPATWAVVAVVVMALVVVASID